MGVFDLDGSCRTGGIKAVNKNVYDPGSKPGDTGGEGAWKPTKTS